MVSEPGAARVVAQLRYLALLLFPDGRTSAVDLGPAELLDAAVARLHRALASRDVLVEGPARALYSLAFQPLRPHLGGVRRVYLAPDGQLGLIPFESFHDGRGFLVDSYTFTYLTSGKELLPRPDDIVARHSVIVFADPDFSAAPEADPPRMAVADAPDVVRSYPIEQFFATRRDVGAWDWVPLAGTRKEAETLRALFPWARLLVGRNASKGRLLGLSTPGILHIATHGFFLEDAAPPSGARGIAQSGPLGGDLRAPSLPDPLLRSGLVLAGARAPPDVGEGGPRLDSSLVTALELAGVNLWGTQLVVLSACDTGRGEVKLGQGVYGLRRALVVAGAETVVMSLWKVNDETTRELMEGYYQHLLAGRGRATALREAMRELRWTQPHPHFWAPFIAMGRDAPLDLLPPSSQEAHHR
jgi:CHAT domain-containing protein